MISYFIKIALEALKSLNLTFKFPALGHLIIKIFPRNDNYINKGPFQVDMKLINPRIHSKSKIDKAGVLISKNNISTEERNIALDILSDWRSAHGYPMHIFKKTLKKYCDEIDKKTITVQRLKRVPSIIKKLNRNYEFQEGKIKLSRMQDIAGCRAILNSMTEVNLLREKYSKSKIRHKKIKEYDYILEPKSDGYRSVHMIYKYESDRERKEYNGLLIEIQIRSHLQHIWATAVETTSFFIGQALKLAEGEEKWNEFFRLISSAFAKMEKCPIISNTPSNEKLLYQLIKEKEKELNVISRMKKWNESMRLFDDLKYQTKKEFFVLELDLIQEKITITAFSKKDEKKAIEMYSQIEKKIYGRDEYDVVLVVADSISDLKKAYPNYFADTKEFIKLLKIIISKYD